MSRNRYEKIRVLGAGSFGEAWLVRSTQSERQYVIKEMKMLPNLTQQVGLNLVSLLLIACTDKYNQGDSIKLFSEVQ